MVHSISYILGQIRFDRFCCCCNPAMKRRLILYVFGVPAPYFLGLREVRCPINSLFSLGEPSYPKQQKRSLASFCWVSVDSPVFGAVSFFFQFPCTMSCDSSSGWAGKHLGDNVSRVLRGARGGRGMINHYPVVSIGSVYYC